ncbi:MAG: PD-(D/E)XK nuclease domain-containing protein [Rectinemataceae bacterium]
MASLSDADYARLLPNLEFSSLSLGDVMHRSGDAMNYVYFPTTETAGAGDSTVNRNRLWNVLEAADSFALRSLFTAFFASISLDNYRNITSSHYEGFYASVVYACFASLGLTVIPEDVTNRCRIDLTV